MSIKETIAGLDSIGDLLQAEIADLQQQVIVLDDAKARLVAQVKEAEDARAQAEAT